MEVIIRADVEEAAEVVADIVQRVLVDQPRPVLGLATGSSPLPTYRQLVTRYQAGELSFAHARAFLLDEYVGLPAGHPEAYRALIERELAAQVDLPSGALMGPDGWAADLREAPARYEAQIAAAGGIDVQLVGIGGDGHIGFNEPSSSLGSRTRLKTLTEITRRDNARFFGGEVDVVPRHVVTQGIATILDARHVVLVATGASKARPVAAAIEGPLSAMVPASALQLHPHATFVLDEAAAADLAHARYYREAYANKPAWQHP